jgi:hypothetical protein
MQMGRASIIGVLSASLAACVGEIDGGAGASGPHGSPSGPAGTSPSGAALDPGRVTMRRLNRTEYDNTLRDLLGVATRPADAFASDPVAFGFDNNGDVQTLTTLQIEQYQAVAEAAIAEVTASGLATLATAARARTCDLTAEPDCMGRLVSGLARRAWRRPVTPQELDRLLTVATAARSRGESPLEQLRLTLVAVLISPHFLFRVELDPDPRSPAVHPVGPFEMASRLSYLIYRSMPDDALFEAAQQGKLGTAADVRREALRMLADPRGAALLDGFAGQWLDLDELGDHQVDPAVFGTAFDSALGAAMRAETIAFLGEFLGQNLPASQLLDARFTFVDGRLATLYGLSAGPAVTRVALDGKQRAGLLTQASVLTTTSPANRTSPVARGAWVLSRLLCAPPPPPPADVPPLPESQMQAPASGRALLEAHRKDPGCAACHRLIDPIGLGLENYDAIGRWRDTDQGLPVDASGELPDGRKFVGAMELGALLAADPRVSTCLARNFYTYAVSRHPEDGNVDDQQVGRILHDATDARLRDLVLGVVASEPFRLRRGEPGAPGGKP